MPQAEWDKVRHEEPKSGRCELRTGPAAPDTRGARQTRSRSPERGSPRRRRSTDVGIKKKSFCGSIDGKKPCLHVDFGRFSSTTEDPGDRGPDRVALRDAQQLHSGQVLHQADAGLPACWTWPGCPIRDATTPGCSSTELRSAKALAASTVPGIFVNAEPIMKRYIERNFNGNMNGNLYELEHHDDFTRRAAALHRGRGPLRIRRQGRPQSSRAGTSRRTGLAGADQMLDMDQFLKVYAMEFFLKHWDGYANNTNNTYLYNDVTAVAHRALGNIKFKMIPWGIDQTLQPARPFKLGRDGRDRTARAQRRRRAASSCSTRSGRTGRRCSAASTSRRS